MSNQSPIRTARRKTRRLERERQGIAVAPCSLCFEQHHTAGRNHDALLTDRLCEPRHCEMHEQLLQAGVSLKYEPNPIKRVAMALRAAAVYDRARADAMDRWAALLNESGENQ